MDSDAALVMKIKAGQKQAFRELVERHKRPAFSMALGLVGNRDDAHDISQEAFLRVYRSAGTFDDSQPFLPWFYTIIANLCRTWLKRRGRTESRMFDVDEAGFLLVDEPDPEQALIRKETITALQRALMKLEFKDREIIMLQHFRGMSYDEIATVLEVPRGTVMSRLYYARRKLAKLLGAE
jgi:RNA polymerase sigma-70 factor (ECF subfamily)